MCHYCHYTFLLFFSDENPSFKNILDQIPSHESLKDLIERIQPFWQSTIVPTIRDGQRVLIVAHGTSLRALGESQIELWSILFNGLENTYYNSKPGFWKCPHLGNAS